MGKSWDWGIFWGGFLPTGFSFFYFFLGGLFWGGVLSLFLLLELIFLGEFLGTRKGGWGGGDNKKNSAPLFL